MLKKKYPKKNTKRVPKLKSTEAKPNWPDCDPNCQYVIGNDTPTDIDRSFPSTECKL